MRLAGVDAPEVRSRLDLVGDEGLTPMGLARSLPILGNRRSRTLLRPISGTPRMLFAFILVC